MTDVAIGIVAHPARAGMATDLADTLGADVLRFDHDNDGEQANHAATLQLLIENTSAPWLLLLEDDALPVQDFHTHLDHALTTIPGPGIISLYLGTGRAAGIPPARWHAHATQLIADADSRDATWITSRDLWHAVALAIPRTIAPSLLKHMTRRGHLPTDEAIGAYCKTRHLPVHYTHPSLVDHRDTPTITAHPDGKPRTEPRRAWRLIDTPASAPAP